MKKIKVILLVLLCCIIATLTACNEKNSDEQLVNDFQKKYASDYIVVAENADGTCTISLNAPDMGYIIKIMKKMMKKLSKI